MLTLLYGFTGLNSLDDKTEFLQQSSSLDVNKEKPYIITGLVPKRVDRNLQSSSKNNGNRRNSDLRYDSVSNGRSGDESRKSPIDPDKEILRIGPED